MKKKYIFITLFFVLSISMLFSNTAEVKNVIILVSDGMGFNHMYFSELLAEQNDLIPATRDFQKICLGLNYTADNLITDSAAAATAIFRGERTNLGYLGLNPDKEELESIGEFFKDKGWSVAIITNTVYSDATPAGVYASTPSRKDVEEITYDLINNDFIDVLVAGGLEKLGVNPFTGKPKRNSKLEKLAASGYDIKGINFRDLMPAHGEKKGTMAFVTMGDMNFEDDKIPGEPSFLKAVQKGLSYLDDDGNLFAMIECGRVDDACHINSDESVMAELLEFQKVLGFLLEKYPTDETLLIVLSDHETGGICINSGYPDGSNISFQWGSSDHTGSYVPVLVRGNGSESFNGIFHIEELFPKIKGLFLEKEGD